MNTDKMAVVAAFGSDQRKLVALYGVEERVGIGNVFEEPNFVRRLVSPPQWSKERFGSFEDGVGGWWGERGERGFVNQDRVKVVPNQQKGHVFDG